MSSDEIPSEPKPDPIPSAIPPEPVPEAPSPPPPHFEAQPYVPDRNFPSLGLALTLGVGLVAAVLVGFFASSIGQWFYLVVVFPLVIGLFLGGVGNYCIKVGKLRNPLLAGVAAGLSGVMAMGTMHYFNYQLFLSDAAKKLPIGRAELERGISFAKYLDLSAEEGVTISPTHGGKGMNLGYVGSYLYWLAEILVVAAVVWGMMWTTAAAPFCVACNTWKNERRLAEMTVPAEDQAVRAVEEGDVVSLLQSGEPIQAKGLVLKAAICPLCGAEGEVDITLDRLTKNAKGEWSSTTLTRTTYPGEVLRCLQDGGAE